jgi:hypothetical protein
MSGGLHLALHLTAWFAHDFFDQAYVHWITDKLRPHLHSPRLHKVAELTKHPFTPTLGRWGYRTPSWPGNGRLTLRHPVILLMDRIVPLARGWFPSKDFSSAHCLYSSLMFEMGPLIITSIPVSIPRVGRQAHLRSARCECWRVLYY